MPWENKRLRDVTETDIRQVIQSGLAEHLELEYKSEFYKDTDPHKKESLLDICMFANAVGGMLVIGVPELRDANNQPTGVPDPEAELGIALTNPEATLLALDARVTSSIEERLPLESAAIGLANGLFVIVIRVPNSAAKPHCVRYQGHVYLPSRRERSRYDMGVREIKELVMRTASHQAIAEEKLVEAFEDNAGKADAPYLQIGAIPVFWKEFSVKLNEPDVQRAAASFDVLNEHSQFINPRFNFGGLERRVNDYDNVVQLQRNGLICFRRQIPFRSSEGGIFPVAIDHQLRRFAIRARELYHSLKITGPYLYSLRLSLNMPMAGLFADNTIPGATFPGSTISGGNYPFPVIVIDDFGDIDNIIRPFCDNVHQTFGRANSASFDYEGRWTGRY